MRREFIMWTVPTFCDELLYHTTWEENVQNDNNVGEGNKHLKARYKVRLQTNTLIGWIGKHECIKNLSMCTGM